MGNNEIADEILMIGRGRGGGRRGGQGGIRVKPQLS